MKKFTKVLEDIDNNRYYEVFSDVKLFIKATNEGEAAYKSDSILGAIEGQIDFSIALIEEIPKEEYQKYFENVSESEEDNPIYLYMGKYQFGNEAEMTEEEKVLKTWEALFGDKTPSPSEKMEFYHRMRQAGIEGDLIIKILKNKLLGK
jgi:hypothetical protein